MVTCAVWRRAVPRASLPGSADLAQPGAGARLLPPRPLPRHAPPQPVPARGLWAGRADPRGPAAPAGPSHLLTLPALYSRLQVRGQTLQIIKKLIGPLLKFYLQYINIII